MTEIKEKEIETKAILGVSTEGEVIQLPMSEIETTLITGMSGTGKTELINVLLMSILATSKPKEVEFLIADLFQTEYRAYHNAPYMKKNPIFYIEEIIETLEELLQEMERRIVLFKNQKNCGNIEEYNKTVECNDIEEEKLSHIIFVIDGLDDVIVQYKEEAENLINRIAEKARMCGIHLILSMQMLIKQTVEGIKPSMGMQITLRLSTATQSQIVLGEKGAEKLQGFGDFYLSIKGKDKWRGQAPLIEKDEIKDISEYISVGKTSGENKVEKNRIKKIFKLIKRSKDEIETSDNTLFPLSLFKDRKELIEVKRNKAEEYAEALQESITVHLKAEKIKADKSEIHVHNTAIEYRYTLPPNTTKIPKEELQTTLESSLKVVGVNVKLSGRSIIIIVPLARRYKIPIDIKTMINEVIE